jgi:hypothetical protein
LKAPFLSTVDQGFTYSSVSIDLRVFIWQSFDWEGFGFFSILVLQTLELGGLKFPSNCGN